MGDRGKIQKRLSLRRLLYYFEDEYEKLKAEEDDTQDVTVWEKCDEILILSKHLIETYPASLIMVKMYVIQIIRVLPWDVLTDINPGPMEFARLLLENVQSHDKLELKNIFEMMITCKTFPKLYVSSPSEDEQSIYLLLFKGMFNLMQKPIVEMPKVLQVLSDMVRLTGQITYQVLDLILYSIVQDHYIGMQDLAALLIRECHDDLSSHIDRVIYEQLLKKDVLEYKAQFAKFGFKVIYRLHRLHPCLWVFKAMRKIIVEEWKSCHSAMECLMRVFTEGGSAVAIKLPKLWNSFLMRIKKPEYRQQFLDYCPRLFIAFESCNYICKKLVDVIQEFSRDQKNKVVRQLTVKAITTSLLLIPHVLIKKRRLLELLITLASDKKEIVRKEALLSMGKIYEMFVEVKHFKDQTCILVNFIMHEFGSTLYFNPKRDVISDVIKRYIVPEKLNTGTRITRLIIMWTSFLDDESKHCFLNYLNMRKKVTEIWNNLWSLPATDTAFVRNQKKILCQQLKFFSSKLIDRHGNREKRCEELKVMLKYMKELNESEFLVQDVQVRQDIMTLICELVREYPDRIGSNEIWNELLNLSHKNTDQENAILLKLFASLPVETDSHYMSEETVNFWTNSLDGITKLKYALKCICKHEGKFSKCTEMLLKVISETSEENQHIYLKGIISLGYMAQYLESDTSLNTITNLCTKVIQRQIFESTPTDASPSLRRWSKRNELPLNLRCKVEALKAITRVVCKRRKITLTSDVVKILGTLVDRDGDYSQKHHLGNMDKNWLRLTAGLSFLKMCEDIVLFKSQITIDCFFKMAKLINDPVREVRIRFIIKLGKKFMQFNKLQFGLVNHFLAYFCLCKLEPVATARKEWRQLLQNCIKAKRMMIWWYTTVLCNITSEQVLEDYQQMLPEFSIQIAVSLLAHYFGTDTAAERRILGCLTFLMKSLMDPKATHSFPVLSPSYYRSIFSQINTCQHALNPHDEALNQKLHRVCDIGNDIVKEMHIIKDTVMPENTMLDRTFFIIN